MLVCLLTMGHCICSVGLISNLQLAGKMEHFSKPINHTAWFNNPNVLTVPGKSKAGGRY